MIDWIGLTAVYSTFFIIAASPGPATLAVSAVSAAAGRRSGMIFGVGLTLGLLFWGVVAATGLGAILQTSTRLLVALKIGGGLYLLWLAFRAGRSAMRPNSESPGPAGPDRTGGARLFARGLALNLTNPQAVIAWMAVLSVGLGADDGAAGLVAATLGCALIGLLVYAAYAAMFSLSAIMAGYARFRRWTDGMVAALFASAGLALIRTTLTRV